MIYTLGDRAPSIDGSAWIAENATVIGSVTLEAESSVWFGAVVRGDNDRIRIGARTNVQDLCMLHTDDGIALEIGAGVTIGHAVVLHGCTIGDGALIGIGSVILNHARIGKNTVIGAKSLIAEGKVIPDGVLALGSPAKVIRPLTKDELSSLREASAHYVAKAKAFKATLRTS